MGRAVVRRNQMTPIDLYSGRTMRNEWPMVDANQGMRLERIERSESQFRTEKKKTKKQKLPDGDNNRKTESN